MENIQNNPTDDKKNSIVTILLWGAFLISANAFCYSYYWGMSSQQIADLNWLHEIIIMLLWFISLVLGVGLFLAVKGKEYITALMFLISGLPLLFITSWVGYIMRSNTWK